MLYSIQNAYGEVYGMFAMPETEKTAAVIAQELQTTLNPILGINGVVDAPLVSGLNPPTREDRIVIDIEPVYGQEAERIQQVHVAIGNLTMPDQTTA